MTNKRRTGFANGVRRDREDRGLIERVRRAKQYQAEQAESIQVEA